MSINLKIDVKDRVLNTTDLADFLGVTRQTVWKMEKNGDLPTKKKIIGNRGGWLLSDMIDWVRNQDDVTQSE